jgi:hypothetical protein
VVSRSFNAGLRDPEKLLDHMNKLGAENFAMLLVGFYDDNADMGVGYYGANKKTEFGTNMSQYTAARKEELILNEIIGKMGFDDLVGVLSKMPDIPFAIVALQAAAVKLPNFKWNEQNLELVLDYVNTQYTGLEAHLLANLKLAVSVDGKRSMNDVELQDFVGRFIYDRTHPFRWYNQVRNPVEKSIDDRLFGAENADQKAMLRTLYDSHFEYAVELFPNILGAPDVKIDANYFEFLTNAKKAGLVNDQIRTIYGDCHYTTRVLLSSDSAKEIFEKCGASSSQVFEAIQNVVLESVSERGSIRSEGYRNNYKAAMNFALGIIREVKDASTVGYALKVATDQIKNGQNIFGRFNAEDLVNCWLDRKTSMNSIQYKEDLRTIRDIFAYAGSESGNKEFITEFSGFLIDGGGLNYILKKEKNSVLADLTSAGGIEGHGPGSPEYLLPLAALSRENFPKIFMSMRPPTNQMVVQKLGSEKYCTRLNTLLKKMKLDNLTPDALAYAFFETYEPDGYFRDMEKYLETFKSIKNVNNNARRSLLTLYSKIYQKQSADTYSPEEFRKFLREVNTGDFLGDLGEVTLERLRKNKILYQLAFETMRNLGSDYETKLLKKINLSKVTSEVDSVPDFAFVLRTLDQLAPQLSDRFITNVQPNPKLLSFDYQLITDENVSEVTDILRVLGRLSKSDRFVKKYNDAFFQVRERISECHVAAGKIEDVDRLFKFMDFAQSIVPFDKAFADKLEEDIAYGLDFLALVNSGNKNSKTNRFDLESLEKVRLKLNEIDRVYGDEFLLSVGIALSKLPLTKDDIDSRLQLVNGFFSKPAGHQDVDKLYEMLGRFVGNSVGRYIQEHKSDFSDEELEKHLEKLEKYGVLVSITDSSGTKLWNNLKQGNIRYIVGKGIDRFTSSDVARETYQNADVKLIELGASRPGFKILKAKSKGENIATLIIGDYADGARAVYRANVGTGMDFKKTVKEYDGRIAAFAVAAFTTGERKIADLSVIDGKIANYLVSDRDGLAVFYPDGRVEIKHIPTLKQNDLASGDYAMKNVPMDILNNPEDFLLMARKFNRAKASAFQGYLFVYNGEILVGENSSPIQDKRRYFAIMNDGKYALIDFDPHITNMESALLAVKMGVKHLIYLDTGMYDYSSYWNAKGKPVKLGTYDSVNPSNALLLVSDPSVMPTSEKKDGQLIPKTTIPKKLK